MAYAESIDTIALSLRKDLGLPETGFLDVIQLLDRARSKGIIARYLVLPDIELPDVDAYWEPATKTIAIRASIFQAASAEEPRARFTIAHEVAHAVLGHTATRFRKPGGSTQFGRFVDREENDADDLAEALLAPISSETVTGALSAEEVSAVFGLPSKYANRRAVTMEKLWRRKSRNGHLQMRRTEVYDTGEYEFALRAMMRNAEPPYRR